MKINKLYEGLIISHDVEDAILFFNTWYADKNVYAKKYKKTMLSIFVTNIPKERLDDINKFANNYGYFPASYRAGNVYEKYEESSVINKSGKIEILYEPKYNTKVDFIEKGIDKLYHITYTKYIDKIKRIGLIPKAFSKLSNHPDRIYFSVNTNGADTIRTAFEQQLKKNNKVESLSLIVLDVNKLNRDAQFYYDPRFKEYGVYTINNISPNSILTIEK
jgi:hypothetical protein